MARSFTAASCAFATASVIGLGAFAEETHGAIVIDFNGLAGVHDLWVAPYSEDGYTLTSTVPGQAAQINGFQPNGLFLAGTTTTPQVVRLMNATNDPFDLLSIAIGDNSLAGATAFTGSNGASYLVTDNDLGVGVNFAALGGWQSLAWVDITVASSASGAPGQLTADNLTVQTVPGPSGAAALAAFALAGLGRQRNRANGARKAGESR